MYSLDDFRKSCEKLTAEELSLRIHGEVYVDDEKKNSIAMAVLNAKRQKKNDTLNEETLDLNRENLDTTKKAMLAAWISAGAAVLSMILSIIAIIIAQD